MYDKISFQFSDGFAAQYQKWRKDSRIRKDATGAIWVNGGELDKTREKFGSVSALCLTYTSVSTLEKKRRKRLKKDKLQTGDLFWMWRPVMRQWLLMCVSMKMARRHFVRKREESLQNSSICSQIRHTRRIHGITNRNYSTRL